MDRDEATKKIRQAAAEGRIEFAEELDVSEFGIEFVREFFSKIMRQDWDNIIFVSCESSCLDGTMERDEILADLQEHYHIDCSDIAGLNLYRVMRRAADSKLS